MWIVGTCCKLRLGTTLFDSYVTFTVKHLGLSIQTFKPFLVWSVVQYHAHEGEDSKIRPFLQLYKKATQAC